MSAPPGRTEDTAGHEGIRTLLDTTEAAGAPILPPELRQIYGGDLRFPAAPARRPYVIGNFVATLDGVVSFQLPGRAGGGAISGNDPADRFIMGLLRASADAVVVGSATLHATAPDHLWTADFIRPDAAGLYAAYRHKLLGTTSPPLAIIVTASGRLDLGRAVFHHSGIQTVVITTPEGNEELRRAGADDLPSTALEVMDAPGNRVTPDAILAYLRRERGVRLLLHEGGPGLLGQFVARDAVDDLFLTVAPQIAGRSAEQARPGMIEETAFPPETAPWFRIVSVKHKSDHLYLRYRRRQAQY